MFLPDDSVECNALLMDQDRGMLSKWVYLLDLVIYDPRATREAAVQTGILDLSRIREQASRSRDLIVEYLSVTLVLN